MIKIIHYCWFGGNPKSEIIKKCIKSWEKFFPGWEIREWNESNFDININLYVKQAYEARKWAFVSDYCRFWALEKYGGIYFDTDVEVVKKFDDLLENAAFSGFETDRYVNPGIVLYSRETNNDIIKSTRRHYDKISFLDENNERIRINVCNIFTNILKEYGLKQNGEKQICNGFVIYPKEFFCPFDDATGILNISEKTYSIHWFDKSWMSKRRIIRNRFMRVIHRIFGVDIRNRIGKCGRIVSWMLRGK